MSLSEIMDAVTAEVPLGARKLPRQQRSKQKMERVIAAAVELITVSGVEAVAAVSVADRAEVSVGWLYSYFETLDALHEEILVASLRQLDSVLDEVGFELSGSDWREKAQRGIEAIFTFFDENPGYRRLWFSVAVSGRMSQAGRLHDLHFAEHLALSVTHRADDAPNVSLRTVMLTFVGILDRGLDLAYYEDPLRANEELFGEIKRIAVTYLADYLA